MNGNGSTDMFPQGFIDMMVNDAIADKIAELYEQRAAALDAVREIEAELRDLGEVL
jgi:hypothetical protein